MDEDSVVILDANVLIPPLLCDLLLRLAEDPRLYQPRWSIETLKEVHRNQQKVLGWTTAMADYWAEQVGIAFPGSTSAPLVDLLELDEINANDRHVVEAALAEEAAMIVTENLRDFPRDALARFNIQVTGASGFLSNLLAIRKGRIQAEIENMALRRRISEEELLARLERTVPKFVQALRQT